MKYGMEFSEFKERFNKEEIPQSYSHEVEMDYLEWEGLINRLSKYKSLLATIS